jgi:hypothetical protein
MKTIENGEIVEDTSDNPDLEREFWKFRDELQQDEEAEGFIKVWRLPLDASGKPRSNSMQQSLLFETPIGESSIDDIVARLRKDYIRKGEHSITAQLRGYRRGHRGIKFSKIMTIERENESEPTNHSGQPGIVELMALMNRNAEQQAARTESFMREMMLMRQQSQSTPVAGIMPQDPVGMMTAIGTMMATFQKMFSPVAPVLPVHEVDLSLIHI